MNPQRLPLLQNAIRDAARNVVYCRLRCDDFAERYPLGQLAGLCTALWLLTSDDMGIDELTPDGAIFAAALAIGEPAMAMARPA